MTEEKSAPETVLQHQPFATKLNSQPLVPPIYQNVKFKYPSYAAMQEAFANPTASDFFYSRDANPTVSSLAATLGQMLPAEDVIITTSGMGAIYLALLGTLEPGDRLIHTLEGYKPIRKVISFYKESWRIEPICLSILDRESIAKEIAHPKTKAIIFESPTNPQLRSIDLEWLSKLAAKHNVLTLWDHTTLGPRIVTDAKIDIYIQSLTKFASGHGDIMGGAIAGSKKALVKIREHADFLGHVMDPHTAFLMARGLRTFDLRWEKASASAKEVTSWMQANKAFDGVVCNGPLIYASLKEETTLIPFLDNLRIFANVASFGSCESLIAPVGLFFGEGLTEQEREKAGLYPSSLRLSIGLESPRDLINDLAQALEETS